MVDPSRGCAHASERPAGVRGFPHPGRVGSLGRDCPYHTILRSNTVSKAHQIRQGDMKQFLQRLQTPRATNNSGINQDLLRFFLKSPAAAILSALYPLSLSSIDSEIQFLSGATIP